MNLIDGSRSSTEDSGGPLSENESFADQDFLFVNETNLSASFKIGGRQKIRADVRSQTRKLKTPALAPQEASARNIAENHRRIHSSNALTSDLKAVRPSEALEKLGYYRFQNTKCVCDSPNQVDSRNMALTSKIYPNLAAASPPGYDKLKLYLAQCAARQSLFDGVQRNRTMQESATKALTRISLTGLAYESSPRETLGAGRVDPFLCYPVYKLDHYVHELTDHIVTYLLPGLIPEGSNSTLNLLTKACFSSGLKNPLVFYALVFAAPIHLDFLRSSTINPNSPRALSHKLIVIQKINETLKDPAQASQDEVILAILILSSHEAMYEPEDKGSLFYSPLRSAQWLNVHGKLKYVPEHIKAVMELVDRRGGLENLELYGLASLISSGDVISSTSLLSKPTLPPLQGSENFISSAQDWANSPPRLLVSLAGQGFLKFRNRGLTSASIFVFKAMGAATIAIDHYLQGKPAGLSLGAISEVRTEVQRRLLSLIPAAELKETPLEESHVYECCRLAALIYGIAVIFPIPSSYKALQELVYNLKTSIEISNFHTMGANFFDLYKDSYINSSCKMARKG